MGYYKDENECYDLPPFIDPCHIIFLQELYDEGKVNVRYWGSIYLTRKFKITNNHADKIITWWYRI